MPPRLHVDAPLAAGDAFTLPAGASRHVQVLRLQPGDPITLFDGSGGQWQAEVVDIGRKAVQARLLVHEAIERELHTPVTLALGMPANERMDALVEKAAELGAAAIVPLVCERSVLRLSGERAERRREHWQAVAIAACEQSGRNRVPIIHPPQPLRDWLGKAPAAATRLVLSLADGTQPLRTRLAGSNGSPVCLLSGPEGGLSPAELAAAGAAGFLPTTLGARVLRADTAPLAALAVVAALEGSMP
ncbi:MAG TPA: 16S rRNA (uracil(1498)-N(3))-methyltransferase [Aquabacterium sp.]|nr:16S rRNA (uracil(1498)-N(3))-methyltransferase [Aquabacterium sp.]HQC97340.1 16S rRNA (uracil(1498)-N(3))-methyltransferase [Aquabacterium sp.]